MTFETKAIWWNQDEVNFQIKLAVPSSSGEMNVEGDLSEISIDYDRNWWRFHHHGNVGPSQNSCGGFNVMDTQIGSNIAMMIAT